MAKCENEFSVQSYGFRPNKNARQAVGKALEHIHEGYTFIVDIDLKTFWVKLIFRGTKQKEWQF